MDMTGRMIMGDHTYKHVYEGNTESTVNVTANWTSGPVSPAKLDALFKRAESAQKILRSAIQGNLDSPGRDFSSDSAYASFHKAHTLWNSLTPVMVLVS